MHQNIKEAIVKATEQDTTHIFRTLGNTSRVFKNKIAKEVVAIERRPGGAKFEDIRELVSGARGKLVYETGDVDAGVWTAGLTLGLIKDIPTVGRSLGSPSKAISHNSCYQCEVLLKNMVKEAEQVITGVGNLVQAQAKL